MCTLKELEDLISVFNVEELFCRLEELKPGHRDGVEKIIKTFCDGNEALYVDMVILNRYMDLGETFFPDLILKSDCFSEDEKLLLSNHPGLGACIAEKIGEIGLVDEEIIRAIICHHENWDGSGFIGFKGDYIPLSVRIIAPINFYVALTSDRSFRKAFSKKKAIEEMLNQSGKMFDPGIVNGVIRAINKPASVCLRSKILD